MPIQFQRPTALAIDHWTQPDHGFATMRVTSPFGPRSDGFHGGLDIGNARSGDAIVAAADGRVLAVGYLKEPWSQATNSFPSGNYGGLMVVIEHAAKVVSIYAHLANRSVSVGESVKAGQRIGSVGATGSAAAGGAHLHFGIQGPATAGVKSNPTTFGYGLDLDPWPLITGTPLEVDDMRYPSPNRPFLLADIGPGNNLRSEATLSPAAVALFLDPTAYKAPIQVGVFSYVTGAVWNGSDVWAWIGYEAETYLVHSKLLSNVRATDTLPVKTGGYTADDLEAAKASGTKAGFIDAKTKAAVAVQGIKP